MLSQARQAIAMKLYEIVQPPTPRPSPLHSLLNAIQDMSPCMYVIIPHRTPSPPHSCEHLHGCENTCRRTWCTKTCDGYIDIQYCLQFEESQTKTNPSR